MNEQHKTLMQLRRLTHADLAQVLAWRNAPAVRRYLYTQHEITLVEHKDWFEQASRDQRKHLFVFEVDRQARGFVNFNETAGGRIAAWGFYTAPDAPKGTGRLLGNTALTHAFTEIGLHKVCGEVLNLNAASLRMHDALGFHREGLLRHQHYDGMQYHDVISFGLLADEWQLKNQEIKKIL